MNSISFNMILRKIRTEYGYTQEEASEGVCSLRNYKRIESGESIPTAFVLNELSLKFNYDFNALYAVFKNGGGDIYNWKKKVSEAIANKDISTMESLIEESIDYPQTKEVQMIKYYMNALILRGKRADPSDILEILKAGLEIENPAFSIGNISIKSNEGLGILNAYANCLYVMDKNRDAVSIFEYLIQRITTIIETSGYFYESASFVSSLYPKCLGGYVDSLIRLGDLITAFDALGQAVNTFVKRGDMKYMHLILWKKVELLHRVGNYMEAKHVFGLMDSLCELLGYDEFRRRKQDVINIKYPELMS